MPVSRTELTIALAITLIGIIARFALLDELAIEHFDEGVYASNLWFPDDGYQYPDRFLYAPPLLPFLIECSMILSSQATWAPFLPSLLLGSLTVPLAWWSVRRWSTGAAGVAAASLIALSDFHITMSRSALTDAPLLFFLLLAVWMAIESISKVSFLLAAAAGLATGLAWSTKYNGWLPLAIAVSGSAAAWMLWPRSPESDDDTSSSTRLSSIARCLAVMVITAAITWSPVWWNLQPVGGYARVAENHSQYVTGLAEWWPSAVRHEAIQRHYARWPTLLSGWLAVVAAGCVLRVERSTWNSVEHNRNSSDEATNDKANRGVKRSTWNETKHESDNSRQRVSDAPLSDVKRSTWNHEDTAFGQVEPPRSSTSIASESCSTWNDFDFVMTVIIVAALAGAVVLSPLLALGIWSLTELIASAIVLRKKQVSCLSNIARRKSSRKGRSKTGTKTATSPDVEPATRVWFGTWLHLAWLCGLLLATPMYRPYPRLTLPLMCVGSLATGAAIVRLLRGRLIARGQLAHDSGSMADTSGEVKPLPVTPESSTDTVQLPVSTSGRVSRLLQVRFIWLVPVVFLCCWRAMDYPAGAWQNRSALADIADEAVATAAEDCQDEPLVNANIRFVIYVYGEPGLFFHIPRDGAPGEPMVPAQPVMDLSFALPGSDHPRIPTYVLAGPHAWKSQLFGQQFRDVQESMKLISVFPYRVSDFVLLDDHSPELLARHRKDDVRLFRVEFR